MMTTVGKLPQSNALAEATPESLAELFSRMPTPADMPKLIAELRAQRARWAAAEAAGKPVRSTRTTSPLGEVVSAKDLDF
jgi:hypothetical protein